MIKPFNSFLFRIIVISLITIISLDIFLWDRLTTQNISEIKSEAHLKIKSALKIITKNSFETNNRIALEKDAAEIKKITGFRTTLIGRSGEVLGDSDVSLNKLAEMENHILQPEVLEALRNRVGFVKRKSSTFGTEFYYYCEPVFTNGKITGFIRFALLTENYYAKIGFIVYLIIASDIILLIFLTILYILVKSLFNKNTDALYSLLENRKRLQSYEKLPDLNLVPLDDIVVIINQIFENFNLQQKTWERENKHLRNIINSLNEGIAVFRPDGLLGFANNNFKTILNISADFEPEDNIFTIIKFPPLLKDIKKFNIKHNEISREIEYYNNKYLKYKINKFKYEKNNIGFIIVIQDITKLHNLETIRSDFVANVSHEFKTPLTSIRGYSETLLSNAVKNDETKMRFLEKIRNQSIYLENLVSDLLKLNRIERKGIEDISAMNICPVIDEIAAEFKIKAEAKRINFSYVNNCEHGFIIDANTKLIYNIVANLIANSIQYSNENGNILFTAKTNDNFIRFEVKDDGIGIPEKDKPRIFERFFRVEKASAVYSEGSGLGLSIVKNAVELLSGKFGFESEENKGSLFWVELKRS